MFVQAIMAQGLLCPFITSIENSLPVVLINGKTPEGPYVQNASLSKIIQLLAQQQKL